MLTTLTLDNFRCFKKHEIPLRERTVIVGRNNAGKSTIVEALHLVCIIAERYKFLSYAPAPRWLDLPKATRGVAPSLDNQAFTFDKVFHRYNDPPAIVTAHFSNSATLTVYVGPENAVYAVLRNSRNKIVQSKAEAAELNLPTLGILPWVAPLRSSERVLDSDYVRQCVSSTLDPLHFRNQLSLFKKSYFDEFKQISESTWHGLEIQELRKVIRGGTPHLELLVRNEDFVAEVSWMGHGLQMWLQTMWFLARTKTFATVILDEPDVYMHADLQRKLIRFVRDRHKQVIIATHSIEIMAEVDPEDVLVVDRDKRQAKFAADLPEVQQIVSHIGGVHNLQLARLVNSKKCLFIEGDDLALLKRLQNQLFPQSEKPIDEVPHLSIGGWGGWKVVVGSSMWLDATMKDVSMYCVLDSDYHTADQLKTRLAESSDRGIRLHVWSKKELENYLLVPIAIHRVIARAARKGSPPPNVEQIRAKMDELAQRLRQDVLDSFANELGRNLGVKSANETAREWLAPSWRTFEGRMSRISGKTLLIELNRWLQADFKISFTAVRLASELRTEEIDKEVVDVLTAFEFNEDFALAVTAN